MKRHRIPKWIKESVRFRQKNGCACCIEKGVEFHHIYPVSLGGSNCITNIVLLCSEHHKLLHLGDLETCKTILEYVYYLNNLELPSDISDLENLALEMKEKHRKT